MGDHMLNKNQKFCTLYTINEKYSTVYIVPHALYKQYSMICSTFHLQHNSLTFLILRDRQMHGMLSVL